MARSAGCGVGGLSWGVPDPKLRHGDDLDKAQRLFSGALKLDITNADLQFLNGLAYHLIGISKDRSKLELAEQGLLLALKFDPSHLAARYQLGLLYMDQRRYALAQGHLAAVALHRPNDAALLYNLAASSYYSHDPQMAEAALNQLAKVSPETAADPDILWSQALVKAALNDNEAAKDYLNSFRDKDASNGKVEQLERRLRSWRGFYEHDAKVIPAQFSATVFCPRPSMSSSSAPRKTCARPGASTF